MMARVKSVLLVAAVTTSAFRSGHPGFATALSASPYSSISVPPGTSPVEKQPVINPLDRSSQVLVVGASRVWH